MNSHQHSMKAVLRCLVWSCNRVKPAPFSPGCINIRLAYFFPSMLLSNHGPYYHVTEQSLLPWIHTAAHIHVTNTIHVEHCLHIVAISSGWFVIICSSIFGLQQHCLLIVAVTSRLSRINNVQLFLVSTVQRVRGRTAHTNPLFHSKLWLWRLNDQLLDSAVICNPRVTNIRQQWRSNVRRRACIILMPFVPCSND